MAAEIPVVIENQGQQIVGMWHSVVAPSGASVPAVGFCHGFGGSKSEAQRIFVETARALSDRGIASLRIDFRGSGDSAGDFAETTVSGQVSDAVAAVEFLKSQPEVDSRQIALLGLSLGGLVAVLSTLQVPDLAAILLWNPVADAVGVAQRRTSPESHSQLAQSGVADYRGWAVGVPFLQELPHLQPHAALQKFEHPVGILLGDADESVPNTDGLSYEEIRRQFHLPVDLHRIEGAGHTFESLVARPQAIAWTVEWLSSKLFSGQ